MVLDSSPFMFFLIAAIVLLAGTINGIAGFGFALVGTMVLATLIDPAVAVVFLIIPILSVNLSLVRELTIAELHDCLVRFRFLIIWALIGTILGLVVLDRLPEAPLRIGLGLISIGFVMNAQSVVELPGVRTVEQRCFVETPIVMSFVGGVSGLLFGGTNVGVQLVAYIRSRDLSHEQFIGVVALVFLGLNLIRVVVAGRLGLYPNQTVVFGSIASVLPALAGVELGKYVRQFVSPTIRSGAVFGLIGIIGIRLILGGLGIL